MTSAAIEFPLWRMQRDSLPSPHYFFGRDALIVALLALAEFFLAHVARLRATIGRIEARIISLNRVPGSVGPVNDSALQGTGSGWTTACFQGESHSRDAMRSDVVTDSVLALKPSFSRPRPGVESPPAARGARLHEKRNTRECHGTRNPRRHYGRRPVSRASG